MAPNYSAPVLVVEDNSAIAGIVVRVAKRIGFKHLDEVRNVGEALTRLGDRSYGLVISDFEMEGQSGLDLVRAIRQDERLKSVPFLMITAHHEPDRVTAARVAGADAVLLKPFTIAKLQEKIVSVFSVPRRW